MKVVWIVLGSFALLALLCCGGGLFFGNRLIRGVAEVNDEADRFAKKVTEEVATDWNPSTLQKYADVDFKRTVTDEQLAKLFKMFRNKLGPAKSIGEFTASNTSAQNRNGKSYTLVTTSAQTTFEKGSGTVTLRVVRRGDKWAVYRFQVNSDALLE